MGNDAWLVGNNSRAPVEPTQLLALLRLTSMHLYRKSPSTGWMGGCHPMKNNSSRLYWSMLLFVGMDGGGRAPMVWREQVIRLADALCFCFQMQRDNLSSKTNPPNWNISVYITQREPPPPPIPTMWEERNLLFTFSFWVKIKNKCMTSMVGCYAQKGPRLPWTSNQ